MVFSSQSSNNCSNPVGQPMTRPSHSNCIAIVAARRTAILPAANRLVTFVVDRLQFHKSHSCKQAQKAHEDGTLCILCLFCGHSFSRSALATASPTRH
jgi:hypothetical protein